MSTIGDWLDFDKFSLKEIFKGVKDDPWRLLVGGFDPINTELWNGILGRDDKPLINQLGGPQGSGFFGLGSGGVFDDFEAQGGDPTAGRTAHKAAQAIAGSSALSNMGGAGKGEGTGGGDFLNFDFQDPNTYMRLMQNMPQGSAGGMPLSAGPVGESEQERSARQHRDILMQQAIRLEDERRKAKEKEEAKVGGSLS